MVTIMLLLLALVAIGVVSSATSSQRQVGGFVAQLPPQTPPSVRLPTAQAGHRQIPIKAGTPLTARLEPGDKVVEVVAEDYPPFVSLATDDPKETIANYTKYVTALAVVKVTKKEARFASFTSTLGGGEDVFSSPSDWIRSTVIAEVQSVLKDNTGRLVAGGLFEFEEEGGEMVLPDGRRIIARYNHTRSTTVGGTYLAVLGLNRDGRFLFDRRLSVEYIDGQIKGMRPDSSLEKKTPEWVVEQVRANAERRKP